VSVFAAFDNLDVVKVLSYGVIGLGLLLAVMAFTLLQREQAKADSDDKILRSVRTFMAFAVVLCVIGVVAQFLDQSKKIRDLEAEKAKLATEVDRLTAEIKPKDEAIEKLKGDATNHKVRDAQLRIQLKSILGAIEDKETAELSNLTGITDEGTKLRLKTITSRIKEQLGTANELLKVK
jgi:hypothetical protein